MKLLDPLPNDKILSLLVTLQCTAECLHCGTISSPRNKKRLPIEKAKTAIDQAKANEFKLVVFTGGEPLLYGDDLFELIQHATAYNLPTRVVTNAFWAATTTAAKEIAQRLKSAGLREINFSTGDQHVRFVSLDNVIRASRAAVDAGLPVSVMVEMVANNTISKESICNHPFFNQLFPGTQKEFINFSESPWMPLSAHQFLSYPDGLAVNKSNVQTKTGCDSIINTTTVLADGRIMACCGLGTQTIPELEVGHIEQDSLATVDQRMQDDFLKRWIKIEGPEKILAWASTKDTSIEWENMYAHRCQACKRIYSDPRVRRVIVDSYSEKVVDVLFQEWLMFHYNPDLSLVSPSSLVQLQV
jgi:hypothetical protein